MQYKKKLEKSDSSLSWGLQLQLVSDMWVQSA